LLGRQSGSNRFELEKLNSGKDIDLTKAIKLFEGRKGYTLADKLNFKPRQIARRRISVAGRLTL
jgi:hypothetical protein